MALPDLSPDALHVLTFGPGTGELVLVRAPPDAWLVIDGCAAGGIAYAQEVLDHYGARPAIVILTHPHVDHAKGVADVVDRFTPKGDQAAWPLLGMTRPPCHPGAGDLTDPVAHLAGGDAQHAISAIVTRWTRNAACRWDMQVGDRRALGSASVLVLSPQSTARRTLEAAVADRRAFDWNTLSTALCVEWGPHRLVLGSDLVERPERGWSAALRSNRDIVRHRVLKIPHHGSRNAHVAALYQRANEQDPVCVCTPFASRRLPRSEDGEGLARILGHVPTVYLTALPRKHDEQSSDAPLRVRRSDLRRPLDGFTEDTRAPSFPDCYVIVSLFSDRDTPSIELGPGSVVVAR